MRFPAYPRQLEPEIGSTGETRVAIGRLLLVIMLLGSAKVLQADDFAAYAEGQLRTYCVDSTSTCSSTGPTSSGGGGASQASGRADASSNDPLGNHMFATAEAQLASGLLATTDGTQNGNVTQMGGIASDPYGLSAYSYAGLLDTLTVYDPVWSGN